MLEHVEYVKWHDFLIWGAIEAIPVEYLSDVQLNLLALGNQTGLKRDIGRKGNAYGFVISALHV